MQLGHQAAQCSVGTVNWRNVYGTKALLQEPTVFPSQIYEYFKGRNIDFEALEKSAREWAERAKSNPNVTRATLSTGTVPVQPPAPLPQRPEILDLPPGWATAKDGQGRIYYWHRETKAVQWEKPTLQAQEQNRAGGEMMDSDNVTLSKGVNAEDTIS